MIKLIAFLLFLFSHLLIILHVAESSPSPLSSPSPSPSPFPSQYNITPGSSISAYPNQTNGWQSPSGKFVFGFYSLCNKCDRHKVGIWINKPNPILVWNANFSDDGPPISNGSSLLLSHNGVLALRRQGVIPKRLFHSQLEEASWAVMHDTGNFVLYNSNSEIVWQSFDHPTDTLLSGQTLSSGQRLLSNNSRFELKLHKHNLQLRKIYLHYTADIWETRQLKKGRPFSLILDSTGSLFILNKDGVIAENVTKESGIVGSVIYRARLEKDGVFRLYSEIFGPSGGRTFEVWCTYCSVCRKHSHWLIGSAIVVLAVIYVFFGCPRKVVQRRV